MFFRTAYLSALLACVVSASAAADERLDELLQQAARATQKDDSREAVKLLGEAIEYAPAKPLAYYLRGREHFRLGEIEAAVADFDKAVELDPASESRQWERGIAYYYDGRFKAGARQFALYQTYHNQDVENSAWRYLCQARAESVEKAAKGLLPIENDPRVPMMKIYELYRGAADPQDVLRAAEQGKPSAEAANMALFYAHLYIGLWHEVGGRAAEAQTHILEAEKHRIGHYMWDVAHIHADRLRAASGKDATEGSAKPPTAE